MKISSTEEAIAMVKVLCFFMCTMTQPFLICLIGNKIEEISMEIRMDLFHSNWYYQSKVFKEKFMIFQERLQRPISMSLCGFAKLNLQAFVSVLYEIHM